MSAERIPLQKNHASYPLYLSITRKERARIAPEILRLTDELMKRNR